MIRALACSQPLRGPGIPLTRLFCNGDGLGARHSEAQADPPRAATEGLSFALVIAAALLALGAVLVGALLRTRRSAPASDPGAVRGRS
ncbi:hypothetical protein GCM10018965_097060 [Nonomuraea roseola]